MSCEEDGCANGEINGMCLTCTGSNYICLEQLSKHLMLRHKIKQLDAEEIEIWKRSKEQTRVYLKKKEILAALYKLQNRIIETSQLFISKIKEITKKLLIDLNYQRRNIESLNDFGNFRNHRIYDLYLESYFKKSYDY